MKYSRRGFVTSTGPNFSPSKVQPAMASTPSFSSSLQKQGCKKFRDSGRRQWALVDRPAAQNAAKGKHGKYIWEASHWGKNQAENVHLIISLLSCFGSGISETRKNAAKEELLYIHFGCFPLLKLFRRCTVFHQELISPSNYTDFSNIQWKFSTSLDPDFSIFTSFIFQCPNLCFSITQT